MPAVHTPHPVSRRPVMRVLVPIAVLVVGLASCSSPSSTSTATAPAAPVDAASAGSSAPAAAGYAFDADQAATFIAAVREKVPGVAGADDDALMASVTGMCDLLAGRPDLETTMDFYRQQPWVELTQEGAADAGQVIGAGIPVLCPEQFEYFLSLTGADTPTVDPGSQEAIDGFLADVRERNPSVADVPDDQLVESATGLCLLLADRAELEEVGNYLKGLAWYQADPSADINQVVSLGLTWFCPGQTAYFVSLSQ